MKSVLAFLLSMILIFGTCACSGNYAQVDLRSPIALPEDGTVTEELMEEIKSENAIAIFTGSSNGYEYEWKIFGSEVNEARDVDLRVTLTPSDGGMAVSFSEKGEFGFNALLSVKLNERWTASGATAYRNGVVFSSVSVTGSGNSVLNLPVDGTPGDIIILPDTVKNSDPTVNRPNSDGTATEQDKYLTDPVPEGKPLPVEPENQEINTAKSYTCVFSIECSVILNNLSDLDPDKLELIPSNGVILPPTTVVFYEGESVFDVLVRVCKENGIHLEFAWTPVYNSAYIEGIHNLYEFDCGALSGWMYRVDGWYPNYGCSRYRLTDGETVEWRYTCELGRDIDCEDLQ